MLQQEKQFDYGIEVLRILLMIFIVAHHGMVHGIGFSALQNGQWAGNYTQAYSFCNSFLVVAVNVFFLISGYFGVKRNTKKAILLHTECVLYAILSATFVNFRGGWNARYLVRSLIFPEIFYWFVFVYIIIIFLAPYFAKVSETLDKREYRKLLLFSAVVIIIFDFYYGYSALGYLVSFRP